MSERTLNRITILGFVCQGARGSNRIQRLSDANHSHSACRIISEQEPEIAHLGAQLNCQSQRMIQREENANLKTVSPRVPGTLQSNLSEQEISRAQLGQGDESIVDGGAMFDSISQGQRAGRAEIPAPALNSLLRLCAPSAHRAGFPVVVEHGT